MGEPDEPSNGLSLTRPQHVTLTAASEDAIRKAIQDGQFAPGSQLPSEKELISMLGVSRTTLREALRALEQQGLIVRRRGKGTFVTESPITKDLSINSGITDMITRAGYAPSTSKVAIRTEPAAEDVAHELRLSARSPLVVVERTRVANGRPVVWTVDMLPLSLVDEAALEAFEVETESLYVFLAERLNIRVVRGVAYLFPLAAPAEIAGRLNVPRGSPLLRITQTDYDANEHPVLFSVEYHVPDSFVFVANRKGPYR